MSPPSKNDDDTNPNLQRTTASRLVTIVQLAVDDVEAGLGGPLTELARSRLVHHIGRSMDLGRDHEREKTVEERRAKEELERKIAVLVVEQKIALDEKDRKIAMLSARIDALTGRIERSKRG
jgi:hypothetical protein